MRKSLLYVLHRKLVSAEMNFGACHTFSDLSVSLQQALVHPHASRSGILRCHPQGHLVHTAAAFSHPSQGQHACITKVEAGGMIRPRVGQVALQVRTGQQKGACEGKFIGCLREIPCSHVDTSVRIFPRRRA